MHLNELKYHAADFVSMLPEQTLARMAVTTKVDRYSVPVDVLFTCYEFKDL